MTPDEALDTLQRIYHSPLLGVVREELERLRARVAELTGELQIECVGRQTVLADLAAARADALRYRWLRDETSEKPDYIIRNVPPDKWDKAIDAALAGKDAT